MHTREPRYRVLLPARLRWDGGWLAVSVRNVSKRGLMITAASLPPPGAYVELVVGAETITARAIWAHDQFCGLRSRNPLDFDRLRQPAGATPRTSPSSEWSAASRRAPQRRPELRHADHSRHTSHRLQYLTALIVAALVAANISWEVYKTMSAPILTTRLALGAPR